MRDWKGVGRVEGCWRRWEEVGGVAKGMGGLVCGGYDLKGDSKSSSGLFYLMCAGYCCGH